MNVSGHSTTTVSLELGSPGISINSAPQGLRSWIVAGAAFASGLVYLIRKGCSDGVRRRVIKRLDIIAPRTKYHHSLLQNITAFNTDCPVCLCDFSRLADNVKIVRILECGHALCASCLEAWSVHCVKAHLNPSRFGITRNGRVVAWTPGPKCPLCCARLNCVPKQDLREAVIAAIGHRGVALSTYVAFHSRFTANLTQHQQRPQPQTIHVPTREEGRGEGREGREEGRGEGGGGGGGGEEQEEQEEDETVAVAVATVREHRDVDVDSDEDDNDELGTVFVVDVLEGDADQMVIEEMGEGIEEETVDDDDIGDEDVDQVVDMSAGGDGDNSVWDGGGEVENVLQTVALW